MMTGGNIFYDVDGPHQAISYGGIGNIHQLALRTGLIDEITRRIANIKLAGLHLKTSGDLHSHFILLLLPLDIAN